MTRNQKFALAATWLLVILFINCINATSELMERARQGAARLSPDRRVPA